MTIRIRSKLVNHLTLNGKKETSENLFLNSIKDIQKNSKKCSSAIFQIAIVYSTPIFKLHKIKLKKRRKKRVLEIPGFFQQTTTRISTALKFIVRNSKKSLKHSSYNNSLSNEILTFSKTKGETQILKKESQKSALANKRFFKYYRWK